MDAIVAQVGSTLVTPIDTAARQLAAPTVVAPTESPAGSHGARGSRTPFDHALFQGNGAKHGIVKRMSAEEIESVQSELGIKAREAATEAPEVNVEPVDAIPVDEAFVESRAPAGIQGGDTERPRLLFDVSSALPEPRVDPAPPTGDGVVTVTEFVQAGLTAASDD